MEALVGRTFIHMLEGCAGKGHEKPNGDTAGETRTPVLEDGTPAPRGTTGFTLLLSAPSVTRHRNPVEAENAFNYSNHAQMPKVNGLTLPAQRWWPEV